MNLRFSCTIYLLAFLLLSACNTQSQPPTSLEEPLAQDTSNISNAHTAIPLADGFDFPLGPPNGKGYYNAQPFGRNLHLGDDWNGIGGGNTDLGDTIFSIATGQVIFAEDIAGGWGNVVRVLHRTDSTKSSPQIEALYAHMDTIWVAPGQLLQRGESLGTVGNAGGIYYAHLHLEIRSKPGMPIGGGYSHETTGYLNPTSFIKKNRPKSD
jgi:murein DD-endopeptidase MepM/ murein hydrolase activator NlpD